MGKIDWDKHYEIYFPTGNPAYRQNGIEYNQQGDEVDKHGNVIPDPEPEPEETVTTAPEKSTRKGVTFKRCRVCKKAEKNCTCPKVIKNGVESGSTSPDRTRED
jgi:hypothetical protein